MQVSDYNLVLEIKRMITGTQVVRECSQSNFAGQADTGKRRVELGCHRKGGNLPLKDLCRLANRSF